MDGLDLYGEIIKGNFDFKERIFNSATNLSFIEIYKPEYLRFFKCIFNGPIKISNLNSTNCSISFSDCSFNDQVEIENCTLSQLRFLNINTLSDIFIIEVNTQVLRFSSKVELNGNIHIGMVTIKRLFDCSNIKKLNGLLFAEINTYNHDNIPITSSFRNSNFRKLQLHGQIGSVNFEDVTIQESVSFISVIFGQSYFNNSILGEKAIFNSCEFNSIISFKNCGSKSTNISLEICTYKSHVFFTEAKFNHLEITDTTFESRVSFTGLQVNTILLHLVNFQKFAYFDELEIHSIEKKNILSKLLDGDAKKWRQTLRHIKQELQKSENKIDYNRFRSYELAAYYQELKWNGDFKDKFILWATKWSTGFEHSWRRALAFTLLSCLLFYSLFFISENYMYSFDINYIREYLSGYFRFLIVTDFYNPLSNGREYIHATNTIGWFIFIFGKIVIAFGIYEMIQAFRKFKA